MRYFFLFLFFLQASLLACDSKQIGKVFMIPCFGKKDVPVVKTLIDVYGVDNILLSIKSTSELKEVMQELSQHAPFPLFYAMDAEIGLAQRLKDEIRLPRALTLGALPRSCEELIFDLGYVIAGRGAAMGIHMNLAPVLDVNSNPNNPVIGVRSFGDDSAQVARKGVLMMQGIEAGGQMACIKHFPGHGNGFVSTVIGATPLWVLVGFIRICSISASSPASCLRTACESRSTAPQTPNKPPDHALNKAPQSPTTAGLSPG